ncbi:beta-ketoacyl synthase domain-containing protein [Colletotrichum graminicola]|nr:beta-ketoacyl synthase domain-containing protein [Colletotrichum graminicola]
MAPSATEVCHGGEPRENSPLEPIAINGMGCRLPGQVDSESSFWQTLVEKRTGQTPKAPESRFDIDAHYHERLDRPGFFNVPGGHFLDGHPENFDPTFFNTTPVKAQWLDSQQRRTLEMCYESLVSAGITLERISGSNTAVFVGSIMADYHTNIKKRRNVEQMSTWNTDFCHNCAATGVDIRIISNRIGHMFNLRGPRFEFLLLPPALLDSKTKQTKSQCFLTPALENSFTINTACSSSIYTINDACRALRMRDCDAIITAGFNLIKKDDQHMNTAKLGILSPKFHMPHIRCFCGWLRYGKVEGAGTLFLKRLLDAIGDGDPIGGVIRCSAVNT